MSLESFPIRYSFIPINWFNHITMSKQEGSVFETTFGSRRDSIGSVDTLMPNDCAGLHPFIASSMHVFAGFRLVTFCRFIANGLLI